MLKKISSLTLIIRAAGCIGLNFLKKSTIALAFFSCGCNQSQIFPRSHANVIFFGGFKKEGFIFF